MERNTLIDADNFINQLKAMQEQMDELEQQSLLGRWWRMDDLRKWLGNKSVDWIKDNVLYNPKLSRGIQSMIDSGYIVHKGTNGSPWLFKSQPMAQFLEDNWKQFKF